MSYDSAKATSKRDYYQAHREEILAKQKIKDAARRAKGTNEYVPYKSNEIAQQVERVGIRIDRRVNLIAMASKLPGYDSKYPERFIRMLLEEGANDY